MKTPLLTRQMPLATVAGFFLTLSCLANAQTSTPDTTQSTKDDTSTADKNNATTGTTAGQPGMDTTNSKDTTTSLDKKPSQADTDSDTKSSSKNPPDSSVGTMDKTTDKDFVMKASQGGMTEVQLGQLAADKGSSQTVKDFGSKMVTDHGKANTELKAIASSKGIMIPDKLDMKHQAMVDKMAQMSGAAFDKAYVDEMVAAHKQDHALFSSEASSGQDPDIKAFAAKTDDVVSMHLTMIEEIQTKMK